MAAFAGGKHQQNYNPKRVAGKLRFVGSQVLDPLVAVMSILSIMERRRRNAVWNAQGSEFVLLPDPIHVVLRSWCLGVEF